MASAEANPKFHASWRHPLQNAQICIDAIPFRALTTRALRFSEKNEAAEVGGILWGKTIPGLEGKRILIQQADFVGAIGRLFNTTESDLDHLSAALGKSNNGLEPVGYFRSAVRGDVFPREQDRLFLETQFAQTDPFLLIIEPLLRRSCCTGHFFFKQDGRLQMQSSLLRVPLIPQSLYSEEPESVPLDTARVPPMPEQSNGGRGGRATPESIPLDRLNHAVSRPPESRNESTHLSSRHPDLVLPEEDEYSHHEELRGHSHWGAGRALFLSAIFLAMVGISVYRVMTPKPNALPAEPQSTAAPETPLGLQVKRGPDGQLDLNWNRDFARRVGRDGARLSIADGAYSRILVLTEDQLLSGQLAYFPKGDDVRFHLEMSVDGNRTVSESIRVVSPEVYASSIQGGGFASPAPMGGTSFPPNSPRRAVSPVAGPSVNKASQAGIVTTETPGTFILSSRPPAASPQTVAQTPQQSAAPVRAQSAVITDTPPPLSTSKSNGSFDLSGQLAAPPPFKVPASDKPARPVATEIPARQAPTQLTPAEQPVIAARQPQTESAKPTYQVMPNTKPYGYSLINNDTQINVQVQIDENGSVRQAEPLTETGGRNSLLTAQALIAARRWRFKPAEVNGKSVPSTYIINFRFRRPQ